MPKILRYPSWLNEQRNRGQLVGAADLLTKPVHGLYCQPSDAEWAIFTHYLGSVAGTKMKSNSGWAFN